MLGPGTRTIENWPAKSRESALRVIDQYGEPDEVTDSQLIWRKRGPWRQIVASKYLYEHNFPAPHYALFELEPREEIVAKQGVEGTRKMGKAKRESKDSRAEAALAKTAVLKAAVRKARLALRTKRPQAASA